MLYLAIRNTAFAGVYKINSKKDSNKILRDKPKCSYRFFTEEDYELAKSWSDNATHKKTNVQTHQTKKSSNVYIFIDFEFERYTEKITHVGLVIADKDLKMLETFECGIRSSKKYSKSRLIGIKIDKEEYLKLPSFTEVATNISNILKKYSNNSRKYFSWGDSDKRVFLKELYKHKKEIRAYPFLIEEANKFIDLQALICNGKNFDSIGLQNALYKTDYKYIHDFNPLDDAKATYMVYTYWQNKNKNFFNGLNEYSEFYCLRQKLNSYNKHKSQLNEYKKRISYLEDLIKDDTPDVYLREMTQMGFAMNNKLTEENEQQCI